MCKLLTAEELAELLGVPERRVIELAKRGRIPCIWIGPRTRRFHEDDVLAALKRSGTDCLKGRGARR